ncbi:cell division protein ZapA [Neorhizobium sp. DAR64862/K0K3]|uniref:cell division protein ZapA n=1 Tax=Neorhizobium sp. DAR64862/K0K3 TaxID=3421957 RepID=UPI003D2A288B
MTHKNLPAFEGIGQVEVDFLGQRIVIGCIEGEEEKTLRLAKRFEIDAGEVTKAVSAEIEPIQAMLMAGILTYEQLEEAEAGHGNGVD